MHSCVEFAPFLIVFERVGCIFHFKKKKILVGWRVIKKKKKLGTGKYCSPERLVLKGLKGVFRFLYKTVIYFN